jgi:hypothetical protein
MVLLLLVFAPVVFFVVRWSWRYQQQMLRVAGVGVARAAGRPGVVADVQITSVLVDGSRVLIGFRPAGVPRDSDTTRHSLLVSLDADAPATIARLRRWEAGAGPVVMWRDRTGGWVELSQMRTGQQVHLLVIPEPAAVAATVA